MQITVIFRLAIILGFSLTVTLRAQDPQFSQFYAAPLYLNPAFAGATYEHRFILNHRLQWPSLPKAFVTYAFSYDFNMTELNSGFGLLASTDKAGSANLRSTNVGFAYSYKLQVGGGWILSPGLYFSYSMRDFDFDRLVFGDQLTFGNDDAPTSDPILGRDMTARFFDFGAGFLIYNKNFWLGISSYHLNEPNRTIVDQEEVLSMRNSIHGGYRFTLYEGFGESSRKSSIAPFFHYKSQGEFDQLDLGFHFHYNPIVSGIWYRGIPIERNKFDYVNQDALVFLLGLRFDQMDVGYSYDITISGLGASSGGSHEISAMYQFNAKKSPKVKRKEKFIPCPTF